MTNGEIQEPRSRGQQWICFDLRRAIEQAETIELTASVLGRTVNEVLRKAASGVAKIT